MFLFYLLGVGLSCHSIFCQFWLCEEAQCVYLRRHLGSAPSLFFFLRIVVAIQGDFLILGKILEIL